MRVRRGSTGRPASVCAAIVNCNLTVDFFVLYRRNKDEHYSGYNLTQNIDFITEMQPLKNDRENANKSGSLRMPRSLRMFNVKDNN